jgi:hypothetical protein
MSRQLVPVAAASEPLAKNRLLRARRPRAAAGARDVHLLGHMPGRGSSSIGGRHRASFQPERARRRGPGRAHQMNGKPWLAFSAIVTGTQQPRLARGRDISITSAPRSCQGG